MSIKRYLVAAGAAGLVFSGVYGAAAALNVEGGVAQAGSDTSLTCDADGVTVLGYIIEQGTGLFPTGHGVKITGIDGACTGFFVSARVVNSAGVIVGSGVKQIAASNTGAGFLSVSFTQGGVPVPDLDKVSISIT